MNFIRIKNFSQKIVNLNNTKGFWIILLVPAILMLIFGIWSVVNYPVDFIINDEIHLLNELTSHLNYKADELNSKYIFLDYEINFEKLWEAKGGSRWLLYKFLFILSANSGWKHEFFILSGFLSYAFIATSLLYILKKKKIEIITGIFLIFSIFFILRLNNFSVFYHSLLSFRIFELNLIISLSILAIYNFSINRYNKFLIFYIICCLLFLLFGSPYYFGSLISILLTCCVSFSLNGKKILFLILSFLSSLISFQIYSHNMQSVNSVSIIEMIEPLKNFSFFVYYFTTPILLIFVDENLIMTNHFLVLIFGASVLFIIIIATFKIRKKNILSAFVFFSLILVIVCSAILFVGWYPTEISKYESLNQINNLIINRKRGTMAGFESLLLGFLFLFYSQANNKFFEFRFKKEINPSIRFSIKTIKLILMLIIFIQLVSAFKMSKKIYLNKLKTRSFYTTSLHLDPNDRNKDIKKYLDYDLEGANNKYRKWIRYNKYIDDFEIYILKTNKWVGYKNVPCYRKLYYWRPFLEPEYCKRMTEVYKSLKNFERKIEYKF